MVLETLRPNAAGDETSIPSQYPDSGSHYDKVDEELADNDLTYVGLTMGRKEWFRDLYNLPVSSGSGGINKIKVYFRCKNTLGDYPAYFKARASVKSGTTVADGDVEGLRLTSYSDFSMEWATNPDDGKAWEWSDIDGLQIGVSLYADAYPTETRCTQVYVEIDYTPTPEHIITVDSEPIKGVPVTISKAEV